MGYEIGKHSKERLGMAGAVPSVPVMPTGAQVSVQSGMLHLKLMGESYVRAGLPSIAPVQFKATVEAIRQQPTEPSYSGSGAAYYVLTVEPDPSGFSALLKAGEVTVGRVAVFADCEIVSADVPLDQQYKEGAEHEIEGGQE